MSAEIYLFDALETVLGWDMPDELLPLQPCNLKLA